MARPVVIFGTGDLAQLACVYLRADSPHQVAAFTVHAAYLKETRLLGLDVVPFETLTQTHPPEAYDMFVAVGYKRVNKAREEIYHECKARGYKLITYVNSKAAVWGEVTLGDNCFIFEENVIQPFVTIGNNVICWSGNHIGHHARIGDHCFVGVNATFRDGVKIGRGCVIGAGAAIMKDTSDEEVYAVKTTEVSRVKSHQLRGFK